MYYYHQINVMKVKNNVTRFGTFFKFEIFSKIPVFIFFLDKLGGRVLFLFKFFVHDR